MNKNEFRLCIVYKYKKQRCKFFTMTKVVLFQVIS